MITKWRALVSLATVAALGACSGDGGATGAAPTAHDAHDTHAVVGGASLAPPEGKLWPTDEALRLGMSRIQGAVEQAAAGPQPLSRESAAKLAGVIEENVAYLIENCRLAPEPDAALHALIGRMMTAAHQLKDAPSSSEPALTQLAGVLRDYRGTFDPP
jgi:hypothetical protein